MAIYVLRHGQTHWNVKRRYQGARGSRLTRTGIKQAKVAARFLKNKSLEVIITSPTVRTMQTARIINSGRHLPIIKDLGFIELNHGVLEGLTKNQTLKLIPDISTQKKRLGADWRAPRGESMRELHKRTIAHFAQVAKKHTNAVIVTHSGVVRALAHHLHGGKVETIFDRTSPDNAEIFEVDCKLKGKYVYGKLAGKRLWIKLR